MFKRTLAVTIAAIFVFVFFEGSASAQKTWNGGLGNDWGTPLNWNPNSAPQLNDSLAFGNTFNVTDLSNLSPSNNFAISGITSNSLSSVSFFNNTTAGAPAQATYFIGASSAETMNVNAGGTISLGGTVSTNQTVVARVNTPGVLNLANNATSSSGVLTLANGTTGTTTINLTSSTGTGVSPREIRLGTSSDSFAGSVSVGSGVALTGFGNINGVTTIQAGGTLSPGVGGTGSRQLNGLTFSSPTSTFAWDLNVGSSFDSINLNNNILNAGTGFSTVVTVTNGAGIVPNVSGWNVFTNVSSLSGTLANNFIVNGAVPSGVSFQWSFSGGTARITAVPEPSSALLLGAVGLIGSVYARRRAKKKV